jgi:endonuclease III
MGKRLTLEELVERLGGHAAAGLGIGLETPGGLERWLWVAALASGRAGEVGAVAAYRALEAAELVEPAALAQAPLVTLADALAGAGAPKADALAVQLQTLAGAVCDVRLEQIAAEAEDLSALGGRLVSLAPGFGPTAAARFLRPLRDRFPVVEELPLAREAAAAGAHLGWLDADVDLELATGTLRAALREEARGPDFRDVEAALERLGRTSCTRRRPARCPLADRCPALDSRTAAGVASFQVND